MRVAPWTREASWTLNDVFRFKHMEPSASQDANKCKELAKSVIEFIKEIEEEVDSTADGEYDEEMVCLDPFYDDRALSVDKFSKEEWKELERVIVMLDDEKEWDRGDLWCCNWFPEYSAVLQLVFTSVSKRLVRILGLDGWERELHFLPDAKSFVSTAKSTSFKILNCGEIDTDCQEEFFAKLRKELTKAKGRTESKRSAAHGVEAGHQKTPTFLQAAVLSAMVAVRNKGKGQTILPLGGMTDVGLHTGGAVRDTCWPIVCAAIRGALLGCGVLFEKLLLRFKTQLMERELLGLQREENAKLTAAKFYEKVDVCFQMLESIVDLVLDLGDQGYTVTSVQQSCIRYRALMDEVMRRWSKHFGDSNQLPCLSGRERLTKPDIPCPGPIDWEGFAIPATEVRDRALRQVKSFEFINVTTCSAKALLKFLGTVDATKRSFKTIAAMTSIEQFLYMESKRLVSDVKPRRKKLSVSQIYELASWYYGHWKKLQKRPTLHGVITVQQRSRCLLVMWIAFCLSHQLCSKIYPYVSEYGIPLDWRGLKVCVLDSKEARLALQNVAEYVRKSKQSEPLFDMTPGNQEPTLEFGRRMGQSRAEYGMRLRGLCDEVEARLRKVWGAIGGRKAKAKQLRVEIEKAKQHLADEEARLRRFQRADYPSSRQAEVYQDRIDSWSVKLSKLEEKLIKLRNMPEFIVNPLPKKEEVALEILFFLEMPLDLEQLANLCCYAQLALNPRCDDIMVTPPSTISWKDHIDSVCSKQQWTLTSTLSTFPQRLHVPSSYGLDDIDDVDSIDAFKRNCMWFPSSSDNVQVAWFDHEKDGFLNPFLITESEVHPWFTAQVSKRRDFDGESRKEDWQWVNKYPGVTEGEGSTRGNLVYAKLDSHRQSSDDFRAFVCLGSLRAFPLQQLRNVFAALEGDILDWSDPIAATVVRQAIYQVGELTDTSRPSFLWHQELDDSRVCNAFVCALEQLLISVDNSPASRWDCLSLLGEIAGFLTQYSARANDLLALVVSVAQKLANDEREKLVGGISAPERSRVRTRECLLYGFALWSYNLCRDLSDDDLRALCELLIRFRYSLVFADDEAYYNEVRSVMCGVQNVMTNRLHDIVGYLRKNVNVLSDLCGLVIASFPSDLSWNVVQSKDSPEVHFTTVFESTDPSTGVHYLVNMASGLILTNGNPPSGLPGSLRELPKYVELFGDQDFEVTFANGVFTTSHTVYDCLYKFAVQEDELFVEEIMPDRTLQLCNSGWISELAEHLPRRLAELYSHWYWLEARCVVLRPRHAASKEVSVLICFGEEATCYQVPSSHRDRPYDEIKSGVDDFSSFLCGSSALMNVLGKFEEVAFIHTLRSSKGQLEIDFPRFGLQFVQDREGRLESKDYAGYVLDANQQYNDSFARFRQHFVLRDSTNCNSRVRRVIIPSGHIETDDEKCLPVAMDDDGNVVLRLPHESHAVLRVAVFDEHPRLRWLTAESIEERLQLAVIYAAIGSCLPSTDLKMTGGEAALETLRGCLPSRPYSLKALEQLAQITQFSYRTPTLRLKANELLKISQRLEFLFDDAAIPSHAPSTSEHDEYDTLCRTLRSRRKNLLRQGLTLQEEQMLMGGRAMPKVRKWSAHERSLAPIELRDIPVDRSFIETTEKSLLEMVSQGHSLNVPFPIAEAGSNSMSKEMTNELRESWDSHHQHPGSTLLNPEKLTDTVRGILQEVRCKRDLVEDCLFKSISEAQSSWRDTLLKTVGVMPTPRFVDLLRCVLDPSTLLHLAPRLSRSSRDRFRQATLLLMELCVLEDKLERITVRTRDFLNTTISEVTLEESQYDVAYFVEELSTFRNWKSDEHPYWLAFEVEGRLQIRTEQYVVAQHLIDNTGSVCQLNMGRGKTRVILPMLFLYFNYRKRGRVVRAHFLGPLLSETRQFMHRVLSAGVLRLPFVEQPFERKTELTRKDISRMIEAVEDIKRSGGLQVVASEHRLSLDLARLDIWRRSSSNDNRCPNNDTSTSTLSELDLLLDEDQYLNVFDESDAILHHKYHLVYADGNAIDLDGGSDRWLVAESLLQVITSAKSNRVASVLESARHLWCTKLEYMARPGSFNGFRLSTGHSGAFTQHLKALRVALIEDLCENPPLDLKWLRDFTDKTAYRLVTDTSTDVEKTLLDLPPHLREFKTQILALRGFLAFGVLEHCLEKRNRVDYGLPIPGSRPKLMAIPFTAADLPAERSEFCQPDVAIGLTLLAYYHAGLRDDEIRQAFEILLGLDESEKGYYYDEWFTSVCAYLEDEKRRQLKNVEDLVLSNMSQFTLLCEVYRFSMVVINFYLNQCVFPRDTRQFPKRMARSAWDLVRGPENIGFSGTNDNHRLLPLGVSQHEPDEPSLRGTNGKMLDLLLDNTIDFTVLSEHTTTGNEAVVLSQTIKPVWESLLDSAVVNECRALIDAGALLAGVDMHRAAEDLARQLPGDVLGVAYYDTRKNYDCWVVFDKARHQVTPLKASPIRERDTFVIFDEARARGSDMKLLPNMCAMLTLGPKMTKDKLMQGAGRLRQLGCNQKLKLAYTDEVERIVRLASRRETGSIGVSEILHWVVQSTQQQCTTGLLEWAQSGIDYCGKEINRSCESKEGDWSLKNDDWSLEKEYGAPRSPMKIAKIIQERLEPLMHSSAASKSIEVLKQVSERGNQYGFDDVMLVTAYSEECERELQVEKENQVEECTPVAEHVPRNEESWNFQALLRATSIDGLKPVVRINSLKLKSKIYFKSLTEVDWSKAPLHGTKNFWKTVKQPGDPSRHLRTIGSLVVFRDLRVLLLTQFETDEILKMLRTSDSQGDGCFRVVQLDFLFGAMRRHDEGNVQLGHVPLSIGYPNSDALSDLVLPPCVVMACRLFNGDTSFLSKTHRVLTHDTLRQLLTPMENRAKKLRNFLVKRRLERAWNRSCLHQLTEDMHLDDVMGSPTRLMLSSPSPTKATMAA
ncbi:hypothetical protein Poli38472_013239 [Pythium oligandrum]|uniref:ubiquitinyl hydrolase 1 n=1 Tax=Pythium oligandrum TaxID=41045 RepID=A0A8K1FDY9_PYTOL|nr:hypothetical protein Poli38472_013239 [Pythium oligandrum]|eukprot:TMW55348.1 hypothetical protein Poli38472_013239 [Pythium oligandrum]